MCAWGNIFDLRTFPGSVCCVLVIGGQATHGSPGARRACISACALWPVCMLMCPLLRKSIMCLDHLTSEGCRCCMAPAKPLSDELQSESRAAASPSPDRCDFEHKHTYIQQHFPPCRPRRQARTCMTSPVSANTNAAPCCSPALTQTPPYAYCAHAHTRRPMAAALDPCVS